jgi:hypothetical protein
MAASKLTPQLSKRKKCHPYTLEYMTKLKEKLNLHNPLDAATFVCLTTCFYAAGHVGEFMVKQLDHFDHTKHPTPANLRQERDQQTTGHSPSPTIRQGSLGR